MLYFKRNDDIIEKYEVEFDEEVIKMIKSEINEDFQLKKMEEIENNDLYYREYEPLYLIDLIDKLLNYDSKAIDNILNYDNKTKLSIDDIIDKVSQEFISVDKNDIETKKIKLKQLENLFEIKELNQDKDLNLYYIRLMLLIKFKLIDKTSFNELASLDSFIETDVSSLDSKKHL